MFIRVEPTGCCKKRGLCQIRFCMYLDEDDYGYDIHHVQVPVIPSKGYRGRVDRMGFLIDTSDYDRWIDSLPKVWQTNPFHNHFIYVEPNTTDKEIMALGMAFLEEAYVKWASGETPSPKNPPTRFYANPSYNRLTAVEAKVKHLKETILEEKFGYY